MADERPPVDPRLQRLLESPLDAGAPTRKRRASAPRAPRRRESEEPAGRSWGPLLGGLVAGGLLAIAGYVVADGGSDPVPITTPPPTVTAPPVTAAAPPFGDLPAGYHALNDRVGARPERILARDDALFVSFTTAVRNELDPDQTAGFTRGIWHAVLDDGRRIESMGEFTDPFARGTFTLGFPIDGYEPGQVTAVELSAEGLRSGLPHDSVIQIEDGLPWSGLPSQTRIVLEGDLSFVIDAVDLESEGGRLDWHLEGGEESEGAVSATLELTAEGTFPAGFMFPRSSTTFLDVFGSATAPDRLAREGTIELVADRVNRPSTVRTIVISWVIDWFSFVPAEATIPLDGVPLVTAG